MSGVSITFEDTGSKGRFIAHVAGHAEVAELTVSKLSDAKWIADHTGVPDSLRGTGTGRALVERLVADARAAGRKILPLCPFVRAEAARHPEWRDVFD